MSAIGGAIRILPEDEGWYVLNTKDAVWYDSAEFGRYARWEGTPIRYVEGDLS